MATKQSKVSRMTPAAKDIDLGGKLAALIALANELRDDHATAKTAMESFQTAMKYMALSAAGLTIGSVAPEKVKIANTVTYLIDGVVKTKASAEVAFTAATHDIAADAQNVKEAVYLLSLAADGTPTITKGTTATGAGNAAIPAVPANQAPIGHVRIAVAAGATPFDATTNALNAAHLTVTYTDLAFVSGAIGAAPAALSAAAVESLD